MKKRLALMTVLIFGLSVAMMSCVTTQVKPTEKNFVAPKIELEAFEVPFYDGYWYFAAATKPTKGEAGDRGAFLPMTFTFKITNPNEYPINLKEIKYSVAFDKEFVMITSADALSNWIPPGMCDQVKVTTMITARSALVGLLLANAVTLKAKGWEAWATLEKWWKGVPDGTTPVTLTECTFMFAADGVTKVYPFTVQAQ
ncbi:MAG: hypothetical protein QG552_21 [Thermodesulfobacteriota bacterium]|nr:hypothetical protein [Thermodesulfobacteriota bacterium]